MRSVLKPLLVAAAAAILAVAAVDRAHACACCSEPGQRLDLTSPLDASFKDELQALRFSATVAFFTDAGFPESIEGVADPASEPYKLAASLTADRLTLSLTGAAERKGGVVLPLPADVSRLEIDPRVTSELSAGGGPVLYKEWRLSGTADLDGILAKAAKRATARFILHGQGNGCTSSIDFSHWTLEVRGPGIRFTLLGAFER
jgi:hypothetical protein